MDTAQLKRYAAHTGGGLLPILSDLHIYTTPTGNRLQAGNGRYYVDGPTDLPAMTVNADRLVTAFSACGDDPTLSLTDVNLTVKRGRVKARVSLTPTEYPKVAPTPPGGAALAGVVEVLGLLAPYVAEDASRPWATSVCLSGGYAYATNNVIVARHPLPSPVTTPVNIPGVVIPALAAFGEARDVGYDGAAVTFYYEDGTWVRTSLVTGDWPTATVDGMLAAVPGDAWTLVDDALANMLTSAAKLSEARHPIVEFNGNGFSLTDQSFQAEDVDGVPAEGRVAAKMAALVFGRAEAVQWHTPRKDVHAFKHADLLGVLGGTK